MENLSLVVMAAGVGSRFGGLKQITPVDDENNFIIDYSVYDALRAGFNHIVFVINEENYEDFKETIGKRLENKIKIDYAFQKKSDIPYDKSIVDKRVKPWGTVQAVLASKDYVKGSFAVINADDFYGYDSYVKIVDFFKENKGDKNYVSIPYPFKETICKDETVKRGVCSFNGELINGIIECSISKSNNVAVATPLDGRDAFEIPLDALVSMNMFGFTNDFYNLLEEYFKNFFNQSEEEILKGECLLPSCLEEYINKNEIYLYSRPTTSKWLGMTYKEDLEVVKRELKKLKDNGSYNKRLW